MSRLAPRFGRLPGSKLGTIGRLGSAAAAFGLAALPDLSGRADEARPASRPPERVARADASETKAPSAEVHRLANAPTASTASPRTLVKPSSASASALDPIAEAKRAIADCRESYAQVKDYTCTLYKRERIGDRLTSQHIIRMKTRTEPLAIYVKFAQPTAGREAIYVAGKNKGRAWVHDVGLGKLLAGTLSLDPRSSIAMEDCRHPITEAGIGFLIDCVGDAWSEELDPKDSVVSIHPAAHVGDRPCTMIESTHPQKRPGYRFHLVKLYIDRELNLPIRFEAYDWPKRPGAAPELVEEYTFADLRLNVGLRDADFDPANKQYSFGRF